jgi:hypothetical protein
MLLKRIFRPNVESINKKNTKKDLPNMTTGKSNGQSTGQPKNKNSKYEQIYPPTLTKPETFYYKNNVN